MKEKQTVGSPFTGTFPSDCIPKVTKDVNVQLFIHSFTFRDELIMDNALPALPFLYSHQLKIFASRWWWFHSEDCCFVCGSYKKHHVSSPLSMLRTLLSFTNHIKEVTRNAHLCFFLFRHQHSRYQRWKKKSCSIHHEEYCDDFRQKFQPLMQFGPQISFCHFSQPLTHTWYLLQLLTLKGDHYTDHHQQSCNHQGKIYASQTPEIFSLLCDHTVTAACLMSLLVISEAKHKIWYPYVVQLRMLPTVTQFHTH